jgi:hypothetical protein
LALAREIGEYGVVTFCMYVLGDSELGEGNVARARRLYQEMLTRARKTGQVGSPNIIDALIGLGRVALA